MGNQYGPYVMYFLSQLRQKQRAGQGGAALYEDLAHLEDAVTDYLYGYWIARVNPDTLALSEV